MTSRTPAQLAALAAAREKRQAAAARVAPEGWRSPEHLLDDTREFLARRAGATAELAQYLGVDESSIRRWVKREKMPLQETLDSIARWRRVKASGL